MTALSREFAQPSSTTADTSPPWTPAHHAKVNKTKPLRLLELGKGPHGKNARFEFPEGWQRTIDLPTQADGWHPLFNDLSPEDCWALRGHVAQPVVIHPDGRRTQSLGLSFTTVTRRGRERMVNYFDVPSTDDYSGQIEGYRCAGELLQALQRGYGPHIDLGGILCEVYNARTEGFRKSNRTWAACAFINVVEEALAFLATRARHGDFIADRIAAIEKYCAQRDAKDAEKKAEFVERMRQARAAKRAARAQGSAAASAQ